MSFDRPLLLLTLLLVPLAAVFVAWVRRRRQRHAVNFTNLEVLSTVVGATSRRSLLPAALGLLALAALCVGVAGPHVTRNAPIEQATVILAVDTSRSMLSEDVVPTRLEAAKAAAHTFVEQVPDELRVGIVVFAGDAQVTAFPTSDRDLVRTSIGTVGPSFGGGTAIGDALARSVELAESAFADPVSPPVAPAEGAISILLLSDGRQRWGVIQPDEGARRAQSAGIPVYTVALGTEDGGGAGGGGFGGFGRFRAPDPETLQAIAEATGGEFFAATSSEALTTAYADLGSRLGRAPRASEVTVAFVGLGAAVLLLASLLSARWWPRLP